MNVKSTLRLAVLDCSVRNANLPKNLPKDIMGNKDRVLESEASNTRRISQFYRKIATDYKGNGGKAISLTFPLIENINGFSPKEFDALIITDSFYTPTAELVDGSDYMKRLLELIRKSHENNKPVLGVCFGHEAIGAAYEKYPDYVVGENYRFIRFDSISIAAKDCIMEGLPGSFFALFNNRFRLTDMPDGAILLATKRTNDIMGMRMGSLYGFQFQLDYTPDELTERAAAYAPEAEKNGLKINISNYLLKEYGERSKANNERIVENFLNIAFGQEDARA